VWLSPRDQEAIAGFLGLAPGTFLKRYVRLVGRLLALVDKPNGDCIFLTEDKRCAIHPVKPRQCLAFPFWPRLLESPESFAEVQATCPGVGQGARFTRQEIDALMDRDTPREELWKLLDKR
jgi:Fe-S-cluster containining protein